MSGMHDIGRPLIGRLLALSMTNVFAWMGFSTLSMQWLNAGQAAMLVYTMPIWATLLAWPLSGQRPAARASLGLLLSMVGLWTLLGAREVALSEGALIGVGLALAAALRRVPATMASIATLLTPVIGVFAAAAVLAEPLGERELAGLVLTLSGVALVLRRAGSQTDNE